jgi:hypothetical protein
MTPDPAGTAAWDATVLSASEVVPKLETIGAELEIASVKRIVRSAVWRGGCLDDPWRHAYLRARWIGWIR